jgi:hypothetical protein
MATSYTSVPWDPRRLPATGHLWATTSFRRERRSDAKCTREWRKSGTHERRGTVTVGSETAKLGVWDAVPTRAKEVHCFDTCAQDLEFMVIGVALEKSVLDSVDVK